MPRFKIVYLRRIPIPAKSGFNRFRLKSSRADWKVFMLADFYRGIEQGRSNPVELKARAAVSKDFMLDWEKRVWAAVV